MSLSKIIGLASAALAVYFYTKKEETTEQLTVEREEHEQYVDQLLEENEKLEDMINPNDNAHQSPVVFTVTMRSGGQMLEQNEIVLNCTNTSKSIVEIGDFQARIWIAGYMADMCIPANISRIKLRGGETKTFVLYGGYGRLFLDYVDVKKALNVLYDGKNTGTMRKETFIPLSKVPVLMNMQYLWYWKGGEEECFVYDIPGTYRWKFAGWTCGKTGYNAGNENQQKRNPSHWVNTEEISEDE